MTFSTKAALIAALAGPIALGLPALAQMGPGEGPGEGSGEGPDARFEQFDADGDGLVTEAELSARRAARAAALDADADGYLSAEELTAFYQAQAAERIASMVAREMARADADGDGRISAAEKMLGGEGRMAARLFERADADGDGAVSRAEFDAARVAMRERFENARGRRGEERGGRGGSRFQRWFGDAGN